MIHRAIEFAALAHKEQLRKGSGIPYIVHPFEVAQIISSIEPQNQNAIVAGLLHDTVEDTAVTYEDIERHFSVAVASIVRDNSENKELPWEIRKQHTINHIPKKSHEAQLVCLADKLSNLRSMKYDYDQIGEELWSRFRRGRKEQMWYYGELLRSLNMFDSNAYYMELCHLYRELFVTTERFC